MELGRRRQRHDPIVECIGEIHQPAITIDNRSGDDLTIPFNQLDPLIDHLKSCKQFCTNGASMNQRTKGS